MTNTVKTARKTNITLMKNGMFEINAFLKAKIDIWENSVKSIENQTKSCHRESNVKLMDNILKITPNSMLYHENCYIKSPCVSISANRPAVAGFSRIGRPILEIRFRNLRNS